MTKQEKIDLYWEAKEAYYNGQEIMTDYEFDALEKELGFENKSEIGAKRNPSYTVKHPIVMGSLSKVQIHKDKDGNIDWQKYFLEAHKYFGDKRLIITPKYDGCSFEVDIIDNKIQSISTRGDGSWGKDIQKHIERFIPNELLSYGGHYILRGEVLVKKDIFVSKYSEQFTNPRSFVSGVLNRDYVNDKEFQDMLNDLSIVIYDYRSFENDQWIDYDWTRLPNVDVLPKRWWTNYIKDAKHFEWYYNDMAQYREDCEYALDGIVIKPLEHERINNTKDHRPKDCVAIKFIPMLEETEVVDIEWNIGKTGEYIPIIKVNPVIMDGREVKQCSGHNYGYLIEKKVSIGSKIVMSLAGDIIPFLYKVTNTDNFSKDKINLPENAEIENKIHLMALMSKEEFARLDFINSAQTLNIPNIGPETAKKIFEYISKSDATTAEFFGEDINEQLKFNILQCSPEEIYFGAGAGRAGQKAKKSFEEVLKSLSLIDVIKSCNFRFCGDKVAEQCASWLLDGEADFSHLATEGYSWVFDKDSSERIQVEAMLNSIGKTIEDFKIMYEETKKVTLDQIPIIMTGEPNDYASKAEFLKYHPEYRNTGSWKEVKIVFTNSLESNTGKMKKAREKGIEIRLY